MFTKIIEGSGENEVETSRDKEREKKLQIDDLITKFNSNLE